MFVNVLITSTVTTVVDVHGDDNVAPRRSFFDPDQPAYVRRGKPVPPLMPVAADAVSVTPVPVVRSGVNVVAVAFTERYGPSNNTALFGGERP